MAATSSRTHNRHT